MSRLEHTKRHTQSRQLAHSGPHCVPRAAPAPRPPPSSMACPLRKYLALVSLCAALVAAVASWFGVGAARERENDAFGVVGVGTKKKAS